MKYALSLLLGCLLFSTSAAAQDIGTFEPETPTATSLATQSAPMTLVLDASSASRGLMYSRMSIPVKPGPFAFVYPKWIPGEHGPTGPLSDVTQIRVSANGRSLGWRRDATDLYRFHVQVPEGVSSIDVSFTITTNASGDVMSDSNVAVINWNRDLFYQADVNSHEYYVRPSIILPRGWDYATALYGARRSGDRIDFDVTPLNMLIDSPLDLGKYAKHYLLWKEGSATQWLDIFANKPQDLEIPPNVLKAYKQMPRQTFALYGSRHFTWYHSLLALSDAIGFQGIEHHQSSDDRAPDDFMTNAREQLAGGDLVTHELSHSWNGKYRRPWDLTTLNFQIVQRTDLLWVYEGMNQYLGDLLSFRAGIRAPKDYPEYLASIYARMDYETGRMTTPIIDLTTGAPHFYGAGGPYGALRRNAGDFYTEGELIWLDADTIIRERTGGKKSLDDFLHAFTEPGVTGPITKTYTREDVEQLLNATAPYDWHGFFERYVYEVAVHPPSDDFARAGWKLVYNDKPNKFLEGHPGREGINEWYGMGALFGNDGTIRDVREGSAAWNAGLPAEGKILAVNGQVWDPDAFDYAIRNAQHHNEPIVLIINNSGSVRTYTVQYRGGHKYPHLVRVSGKPDMFAKIMAPR